MMIDIFYLKEKSQKGFYKVISRLLYAPFFLYFGKKSKIVSPLTIKNPGNISIGNHTTISNGVFMMVEKPDYKKAKLIIGDGVNIGNHNHIVALNKVEIGDNVMTADNVYISDNYHEYEDICLPICQQPISSKKETKIGEDTWIGENVCILSANIGKHCVIGANSVVTKDIPDYSIAVGAPTVVIKQYDRESKTWKKL